MHPEESALLSHYIRENMKKGGYSDSDIEEEIDIAKSDLDRPYEDLAWAGMGVVCLVFVVCAALAFALWR